MTNESLVASIDRIERALSRIEAASASKSDARYLRLRHRMQVALTSLDTVIARVANQADD